MTDPPEHSSPDSGRNRYSRSRANQSSSPWHHSHAPLSCHQPLGTASDSTEKQRKRWNGSQRRSARAHALGPGPPSDPDDRTRSEEQMWSGWPAAAGSVQVREQVVAVQVREQVAAVREQATSVAAVLPGPRGPS